MLPLTILLLQVATPSAVSEDPDNTVVVVARRLSASTQALADCRARRCPPLEDIKASMDYAQDQFIVGNYNGASATLSRARERNGRFAGQYPMEVSGLLQFRADLSSLLGYQDSSRVGAIDALDAMKKGLAKDDQRIVAQRLLIGDGFVRVGRLRAGSDVYDLVAEQAKRSGWTVLRGRAMLRVANLWGQVAAANVPFRALAHRRFAALRDTTEPELQPFRDAARALEARIAARQGDMTEVQRVVAQADPVRDPLLIVEPAFKPQVTECAAPGREFVDLQYLVRRDGTVAEIEELRRGRNAKGRWLDQVRNAVSRRRYLPLALPVDVPGLFRQERFTIVRDMRKVTGSALVAPCGPPRVQTTDLTAGDAIRDAGQAAPTAAGD